MPRQSRQRYGILVQSEGDRENVDTIFVGPFNDYDKAEDRAQRIRKSLGMYSTYDVTVITVMPSGTSLRAIKEEAKA